MILTYTPECPLDLILFVVINKFPNDHQDHPHNKGDFPTQGGDADRLRFNEGRIDSNHQETTNVESIPRSRNCPWPVESFLSEHAQNSLLDTEATNETDQRVTYKQEEKEGNVVLLNEPISSIKSKIPYIAGACLHKIINRLQRIVTRNLGQLHKKSQVQRAWSYRMHRLLKSLWISEEQVLKETQVPESLSEIEYRQGPSRGLLHVSDNLI